MIVMFVVGFGVVLGALLLLKQCVPPDQNAQQPIPLNY